MAPKVASEVISPSSSSRKPTSLRNSRVRASGPEKPFTMAASKMNDSSLLSVPISRPRAVLRVNFRCQFLGRGRY